MTQITWKRTDHGCLPARVTYSGGGYRIVSDEAQYGSYRVFHVYADGDTKPFDVEFTLRAAKETIENYRRGAR